MGYYLNSLAAASSYQRSCGADYFVDKSMILAELWPLIGKMNHDVCITRPRRFGKTMVANMVCAYFGKAKNNSAVFDGLKIAAQPDYQTHLNRYNVVYIDFSKMPRGCESYRQYIESIENRLLRDLRKAYPGADISTGDAVWEAFTEIYNSCGEEQFIFVLDEWDSIFHKKFAKEDDRRDFVNFLAGLLKDQVYVALTYMTGILPIAKYTKSSTLNNFLEYTMTGQPMFSKYFGFTEREVDELFKKYMEKQDNPVITREELDFWYDGYQSGGKEKLYNPRSVVYALSNNHLASYWTESGPYAEISDYIKDDIDGIRKDIAVMVSGEPVKAAIQEYSAVSLRLDTKNKIFSAMVVYGFLNYKDDEVWIPNRELKDEFARVIMEDKSMGYFNALSIASGYILNATLNCDAQAVAEALTKVHNITPIKAYNNEAELSLVVFFAYLSAIDKYEMKREEPGGKGYADYIFYPRNLVDDGIIIELKMNRTPEEAIQQIKDRRYVRAFSGMPGERSWHGKRILAVGITYDSKNGDHRCKIEELPAEAVI